MKYLVMIARNEGDEPLKTAESMRPYVDGIVCVDDGGNNTFPSDAIIIKNKINLGVGKSRREAVRVAFENGAKKIILSDAHCRYISGDMDRAWKLTDQYILCPASRNINKHRIGCGARLRIKRNANWTKGCEGQEVILMGGVYLMNIITALQIIFPTTSHGYNEEIMSCSAVLLNHTIYAMPDLVFSHLYRKQAPYSISAAGQNNNLNILKHVFFNEGTCILNDEQKEFVGYLNKFKKNNVEEYLNKHGMVK